MTIIVSGKNFDVTPSLRFFIEQKCQVLGRHWSSIVRIHVEMSMSRHHRHGDVCVASMWVETPGPDLRADSVASDMHAAVNVLIPKIERQIIRAKERFDRR